MLHNVIVLYGGLGKMGQRNGFLFKKTPFYFFIIKVKPLVIFFGILPIKAVNML